MGRRQRAADRALRPAMRSPGHPKFQREIESAFWDEIAKGLLAEEAARAVGVSPPAGVRWFRNGGGMPPFNLKPPSGRYLSFPEREEIAPLKAPIHRAKATQQLTASTHGQLTLIFLPAYSPQLNPTNGSGST